MNLLSRLLAVSACLLAAQTTLAAEPSVERTPTTKRSGASVPAARASAPTRAPLTAEELRAIDESPTLQRIRGSQRLRIAFSKTGSPFSIADTDGSPRGFAIDACMKVALAIQRQLKLQDLRIEFVSPPFTERLQAVRDGTADMECANTISSAERRQTLGFSLPIYLTVSRILVRANSPIARLTDLRGRTVVTTANSSAEKGLRAVNQRFAMSMNILTRATAAEAFSTLANAQSEAFFMSDIVISDLLARAPDRASFTMLRDAYSVDGIAIVLAKGDAGLKVVADRELRRLMADGEMATLYARWFQAPIPPAQTSLNLRLNDLTRDHYKRPSDEVNQGALF